MILGIGIDLIEVTRIKKLLQEFGEKFLVKIFTPAEILAAEKKSVQKIAFYAKRFAAKEAFSKACGCGIGRGIDFLDIEIFNDEMGKPLLRVLNDKEKFLQKKFAVENFVIHLSLTDENNLAQAMVIIEKSVCLT